MLRMDVRLRTEAALGRKATAVGEVGEGCIHAHVPGYKLFPKSHGSPACQPCLWPQSPSWTLHRFRGRGPGPAKAYHGQPPRPHQPTGLRSS